MFAFLEAQALYPASLFLEEGIQESVDAILNDRVIVVFDTAAEDGL